MLSIKDIIGPHYYEFYLPPAGFFYILINTDSVNELTYIYFILLVLSLLGAFIHQCYFQALFGFQGPKKNPKYESTVIREMIEIITNEEIQTNRPKDMVFDLAEKVSPRLFPKIVIFGMLHFILSISYIIVLIPLLSLILQNQDLTAGLLFAGNSIFFLKRILPLERLPTYIPPEAKSRLDIPEYKREPRYDDPQELKERLYQPLFDEVATLVDRGKLPYDDEKKKYISKWQQTDPHLKHKAEDSLTEKLDNYTERLQKLNSIEMDLEREFESREEEYASIFEESLPTDLLSFFTDRSGVLKSSGVPVCYWLDKYADSFITANNPEELRKLLIRLSEENNWGYEREYRRWDDEYSGWEDRFWELSERLERAGYPSEIYEKARLREEIREVAKELQHELAPKV